MHFLWNHKATRRFAAILTALFLSFSFSRCVYAAEFDEKTRDRDPMKPVNMGLFEQPAPRKEKLAPKQALLKVQGVGRSGKGAYVVIDGKVLGEGEARDGVKIVKIGDTSVDILYQGEPESLPIK